MFFSLYPAGPNALEFAVWTYQAGGLKLWQERLDRLNYNIKIVGPMAFSSAEGYGWYSKPMLSLGDFKGLKFRTAGIWGDILTELMYLQNYGKADWLMVLT